MEDFIVSNQYKPEQLGKGRESGGRRDSHGTKGGRGEGGGALNDAQELTQAHERVRMCDTCTQSTHRLAHHGGHTWIATASYYLYH